MSDAGITVTDTYTAGGEVLMGTMRWEKESAERHAKEIESAAAKLRAVKLEAEEAEIEQPCHAGEDDRLRRPSAPLLQDVDDLRAEGSTNISEALTVALEAPTSTTGRPGPRWSS